MSWVTICESLGKLPTKTPKTLTTYRINQVPKDAKEILVYLWIATGNGNGDSGRTFEVAAQTEKEKHVSICFFAHGYNQNAWSYNSENVWLPMPFDNELTVQLYGEKFGGNVQSGIEIRGYKS
jgi:hypothetical protein